MALCSLKPTTNCLLITIFALMILDLLIEKLVQGGEGMARLPDGRVCFVQGALPGELCAVELLQNKKLEINHE